MTTPTLEQVLHCVPTCPPGLVNGYYPFLCAALEEFGVNTQMRLAFWFGQCTFESDEFTELTEDSDGKHYEGRADLGNTQPGDGPRFIGRGVIQLTGRFNYQKASDALGIDLVEQPALAATAPVAFRSACWYWASKGLNEVADQGTAAAYDEVTLKINGGLNDKDLRDRYLVRCKAALGLPP